MLQAAKDAYSDQAKRAAGRSADVLTTAATMTGKLAIDAASGILTSDLLERGLRKIATAVSAELGTIAVLEQREFVRNSVNFGLGLLGSLANLIGFKLPKIELP
jgi:hypothetical protein